MAKRKRIPNTPTQKWLRAHGACIEGRRRVGAMTLSEAFNTSKNKYDMAWLLRRLPRADPSRAGSVPSVYSSHTTPKMLRAWASDYGVSVPLGI